jgi:hypothetical protein
MVHCKPKIEIWVNFGGSCNGRCWHIICAFEIFDSHLVYIMAIWYNLLSFGIFFPVVVYCTKKNQVTLVLRPVFLSEELPTAIRKPIKARLFQR